MKPVNKPAHNKVHDTGRPADHLTGGKRGDTTGASRATTAVHRSGSLGLRVWFGRTHGMVRAHTHHDLEFNCVLRGHLSYFIAGRVVTIHAQHLAVIWGAMPHQTIAFSDDLEMAWGTTPLNSPLLNQLPGPFVEQLLGRGLAVDPAACPNDWPMFERWAVDLKQATLGRRELVQREMELRLLRLALDVADTSGDRGPHKNSPRAKSSHDKLSHHKSPHEDAPVVDASSTGHGFAHVQQMAAYMAAHYTEPVSLDDITQQVPLHPNYAMTLFRQHTHMTLNTYLTRQRIAHAQRLLATTDHTVLSIAMDSGFGSPSRFFEAFKQHAGSSPRAYRKQLAGR